MRLTQQRHQQRYHFIDVVIVEIPNDDGDDDGEEAEGKTDG